MAARSLIRPIVGAVCWSVGAVVCHPQMPSFGEALQPAASPVDEPNRRDSPDQLAYDIRDEHFATARSPGDARCCVDRCAERVSVGSDHFAGVDPDPDPRQRTGQGPLRSQRERHCLTR